MKKKNWKKHIILISGLLALVWMIAFVNRVSAEEGSEAFCPEHGIPLMIIRIDESNEGIQSAKENDPDHKYGTIRQMNHSSDHSVRCIGTTELKVPEGYSGGYGSLPYELTTGELKLEYIRGRGNNSWSGPKRPYKIKLDKKQDLLGMGKSKEWALLAERKDPTLLKNRITFEMGEQMGLRYTPQLVPIEVVMVGSESGAEYLGVYNLTETVKLEKSRIDLDEPDEDATEEEGEHNLTGSYIVSVFNALRDYKEPESNRFFTEHVNGLFGFLNKEPEYLSDDLTEAQKKQREYIRNYINEIDDLIMSADYIDHDRHMQIAEKMDLQSAADYWWIQIFSANDDAYYTSSTYLIKPKNGKLYWGPLWDFNIAYGRTPILQTAYFTEGFETVSPFPWITHLRMCDPEFEKLLKERWQILDEKLAAITEDGGTLDRYKKEVALAQAADHKKWSSLSDATFNYTVEDYDALIEKLKAFFEKRRAWINANLDSVGSFCTVRFDAGEGEGSMDEILDRKPGEAWKLPACGFVQQPGSCKVFDGWQIEDRTYQAGETVVIKKDTVARALWKTQHTWKAANCTEPRTCTVCGRKEGKPSGHSWDNGNVTKAATVTRAGVKTFTCTKCRKTKTAAIRTLKPTIRLSATKKKIKAKNAFVLTVSNLARGDKIQSVKSGNTKVAAVKKQKGNTFRITGKKKGKAVITVTLKSGKKAVCIVVVT